MTQKENKDYYLTFLQSCGLSEQQIEELFKQYPLSDTVVKTIDRREGRYINLYGEDLLILYRTSYKIAEDKDSRWVAITKQGRVKAIKTKWLKNTPYTELTTQACKNYLKQYYIKNNDTTSFFGGETLIAKALDKMNLQKEFIIQKEYEVPELISYHNLWVASPRYDFAILDKETQKPLLFIEYDGKQHYQSTEEYGNFIHQLYRDSAKNGYAFYSLIPLIRIPYGVINESDNVDIVMNCIKYYLDALKVKGEN